MNYIKKNFTIISNKIINDNNLSWGAKGVASYLLSKDNIENWEYNMKDIQKHSNESMYILQKYIKELEKVGFLIRKRKRNDKNQFIGWNYEFNIEYIFEEVEEDKKKQDKEQIEEQAIIIEKEIKKEKKKEIINLDFIKEERLKKCFEVWLDYKKNVKKDIYKNQKQVEILVRKICKDFNNNIELIEKAIENSIANNYKGIYGSKVSNNVNNHIDIDF